MGQRSFAYIDGIMLAKKDDWNTNINHLGLRMPATLKFEDDPISIEKGRQLLNFTKVSLEAETVECDYNMLRDFIEIYMVDGAVNAAIHTAPQQAATDSRGLKGQEVLNFGWSPNGNGFMGFSFKYKESYNANGDKKTSAVVSLSLTLEKNEMDAILALALSNTINTPVYNRSKVNPGHLIDIQHPNGSTSLLAKGDINTYSLEMESKGDGEPTLYGREQHDVLSTKIEITTKVSGIPRYKEINLIDELSPLYIYEKISDTVKTLKKFNYGALSRSQNLSIGEKRRNTITFMGDIPMLKTAFSDVVSGGITTKTIQFG